MIHPLQVDLKLSSEEGKVEAANKARLQAETESARLREEHRSELEGQRVHYTGLLSKATSAQVCLDPASMVPPFCGSMLDAQGFIHSFWGVP